MTRAFSETESMLIFKCNPFLRIVQAATTVNTEQKGSQLHYNTLLLVASFKFVTILIKTPFQPSSYNKPYSTEIMKVFIYYYNLLITLEIKYTYGNVKECDILYHLSPCHRAVLASCVKYLQDTKVLWTCVVRQ